MKKLLVWLCMIAAISVYAQTNTSIKYQIDGIGNTAGDGKGIWFANTSAATNTVPQYSPSIVLEGQGWQTSSSGSQSVKFMEDVVPVAGTTNPSGTWRLRSSINNAAYSSVPIIQANSDGTILVGGPTITSNTRLDVRGTGTGTELAMRIANSVNTSRWQISNQGHVTQNASLGGNSLTATYTAFSDNLFVNSLNGTVNMRSNSGDTFTQDLNLAGITTNGTNQTLKGYASSGTWTVNHTGATVYGFDYNPTITGTQTPTHLAWRNTSGNMLIGGSTLSSASALVDMQSTTKGLVIPRVTNIASVTSPVNGMMAYDAATNLFNFRQNGSWVNLGSVTPTGLSGNLQYNNGGTLGGFGDYNSTTDRLTLTGAVRSSNNFALVALGSNNSYTATMNWYTGSIGNNGGITQGINVFVDDAGVELENRSAIIEFTILLTKADGSNAIMQKDAVYYLKAGTSDPTKVIVKPIYSHGSPSSGSVTISYPNPTTNTPQISITDVLAGGWSVRVTAQVMMSN